MCRRGRVLELHAAVVDPQPLFRQVVVDGHSFVADHHHFAHLLRVEPRHVDVAGDADVLVLDAQIREDLDLGARMRQALGGHGGRERTEDVIQNRDVVGSQVPPR